jgi:aminoglycoside phosphotransferase (APT) family kinase protein
MSVPETTAVREAHRFDEGALQSYLAQNLPHFTSLKSVRQFEGGQSNPTYLLETVDRRYVLRKKPPGQLLPSAHQIEREHKVMSALAATNVAVPRMHILCEDPNVIGTPFFVMDFVEGRIFRDPLLPGMHPSERKAIYDALIEMLANLHKVDWKAIGLGDYGRTENYVARQIARWSKQYEASKTESISAMDKLMEWLPQNIPAVDDTGREIAIVHGDYRLENTIFHPTEPRILAVLDWELSTLGHPLGDLGYNCLLYYLPRTNSSINGFGDSDLAALGIPSQKDYVQAYCERTGRNGASELSFFVVFALFRSAAIAQGIMQRAKQGIASSSRAEEIGKLARMVAERAWELTD